METLSRPGLFSPTRVDAPGHGTGHLLRPGVVATGVTTRLAIGAETILENILSNRREMNAKITLYDA